MDTNTDQKRRISDDLEATVQAVIGAAYEVSNTLGAGFLEKVYERALARELTSRGLEVTSQVSYAISYKGHAVGAYVADLLVENQLLVLRPLERVLFVSKFAACGFAVELPIDADA